MRFFGRPVENHFKASLADRHFIPTFTSRNKVLGDIRRLKFKNQKTKTGQIMQIADESLALLDSNLKKDKHPDSVSLSIDRPSLK